MIYGPMIFGLLFGIVVGSQIKTGNMADTKFTASSYIIIIIAGLIVAWQLGEFPFYDKLPIARGFVFALIGILLSKFIFARSS